MKATLLAALSMGAITKSSLRENIVLLNSCSLKIVFPICYFIFKGTNFFIYWWHRLTFPFWKMVFADVLVIWYFLNELINTSLHFFTSFLKTNLCWFSILWAFGYELSLIINNIQVPCYNMTEMIIYKRIIKFITATFNWIRVFKEFINI